MSAHGLTDDHLEPGMPVVIYSRERRGSIVESPGEIVKVGRTRVYVRRVDHWDRDGAPFRLDGQGEIVRAGSGRYFLTPSQIVERAARDAALATLRAHGLGPIAIGYRQPGDGRFDDLTTERLVRVAEVLEGP